MAKVTKRISMAMAVVFTAFAVLTSATPALAAKKKVVKKAKKKVVAVKKTVKASTSAATASYNKALAAVKVAEGAFKYDMTNKDNVAYAEVKADLAQSAIDAVADNSAKAYLGARLAVVMNKITMAKSNLKVAAPDVKDVVSATSLTNTTVLVKFSKGQSLASAADFTFDNGLTVTNATVKQDDNFTVVLTTAPQDSTKTYKVSYKGTDTGLTVKGMAVATTPSAISFSTKNFVNSVGNNVTLTATVTPATAGVPVTFNIVAKDANLAGVNPAMVKEVVTDAKGVATLSYTRFYGGDDTIRVYPTGAPAIGDTAYAFWGQNPKLAVTKVTTTTQNGGTVTYNVTLKDNTGKTVSNRYLNVLFKENINATGTSATATNLNGNQSASLYQRDNAGQQLLISVLTLTTDANGFASFSVTGTNTTATPVIYDTNYNSTDTNTNGNTPYYNAQHLKYDAQYLQVVADSAVFGANKYGITTDVANGSTVNATTGFGYAQPADVENGAVYTVTVKNADGTAYAGGVIHVGIKENIDGMMITHAGIDAFSNDKGLSLWSNTKSTTDAWNTANSRNQPLWVPDNSGSFGNPTKVAINLNENGQAKFVLVDNNVNEVATPLIWIDQTSNSTHDYVSTDPSYVAGQALFVASQANGITVSFRNSLGDSKSVTAMTKNSETYARIRCVDQAGNLFQNLGPNNNNNNGVSYSNTPSSITYTVANTGSHDVYLSASFAGSNFDQNSPIYYNGTDNRNYGLGANGFKLQPGTSVTITGKTSAVTTAEVFLAVFAQDTTSVKVDGQFVANGQYYYASNGNVLNYVNDDTLPVMNGAVYTGTVSNVLKQANAAIANSEGAILIHTDNGSYVNIPVLTIDNVREGTDKNFVNNTFSYTTMDDFANKITAGDRIQVVYGNGAANVWTFVNVDNSVDKSEHWATQTPVTTSLFTNPTATFDGMLITTFSSTVDAKVTKVDVVNGTTVLTSLTPAAGKVSSNTIIGAKKGDTLTLKAYDSTNTCVETKTITVQ